MKPEFSDSLPIAGGVGLHEVPLHFEDLIQFPTRLPSKSSGHKVS